MIEIKTLSIDKVRGNSGLEKLVVDVDQLVSLPNIYYRLEEEVMSDGSTAESVAKLLQSDPDLCARLLRLANSAFFSFPTNIETVERAIGVIGLRQIRELVLATSVIKAFEGLPPELVNMHDFWEHSIAVGVMACSLAKQGGIAKADSFYIPGLLHDIGRLVLYLKFPDLVQQLLQRHETTQASLFSLEQSVLDYSHADIGAKLLQLWRVPEPIWQPIACHHQPENDGETFVAASAIHIADAWVNANMVASDGSCYGLQIRPEALNAVGLEIEDLAQIGGEAREKTKVIARQFLNH